MKSTAIFSIWTLFIVNSCVLVFAKPSPSPELRGAHPSSLQELRGASEQKRTLTDSLPTLLYHAVLDKKPGSPTAQFAVLYMHDNNKPDLDYDNKEVSDILNPTSLEKIRFEKDKFVWPETDVTNLAVAKVHHNIGLSGHTEQLLLQKFDVMLAAFKNKHTAACPSHIIIISRLAPCAPKMKKGDQPTGCTKRIIDQFKKSSCPWPATKYVVGYHSDVPSRYKDEWAAAEASFVKENIKVTKVT